MAFDSKRKSKPKYAHDPAHVKGARSREDGYEAPHTLWIREDLWARLKTVKRERGKSLKYLVNEALYESLMRADVEKGTGTSTPFKESEYYPERKHTGRKFESDD